MSSKLREWVFKMRGGLWTVLFVIILFASTKTTPARIFSGLVLILLGQAWRCWSVSFIGLYRGESVKANKLATSGPYAIMRNPLYFGNFLIGSGWGIIAGVRAILIFIVSFYVIYDVFIIPHEENFLLERFGEPYKEYCERVKRFYPDVIKLSDIRGKIDFTIIKRSEIHTIISTLIGTLIVIVVCYT